MQDIATAAVVVAELRYGAAKSIDPHKTISAQDQFLNLITILDFERKAAEMYGQIRAELARKGTPIGPNDLFIAATAKANGLILVTHNIREFGRVVGLQYEDWE
jgi:tRNA(fMet)-specific endonuclease VapC